MQLQRHPWLILTGKLVFGVAYCLLGGEIFLRVLAPRPMAPRHVCAMAYGIRGNEPNESYRHSSAEFKIHIRTNSKGMRSDVEIPYEKPAGVRRIVLLGDSLGMGYEVSLEHMFTARMVHHLKESYGIDAEVVNLSTSGHGNAEELIVLEHEGVKYQPDLVLLAWHATDYDDNARSGLYKLTDGALVRDAPTYLPGVEIQQFLYRSRMYRFVADNSNLYNVVRDQTGAAVKRVLVKLRTAGPTRAESGDITESSKADLTIALLREIQRVSRAHGAAFLILDIPVRKSRTEFVSLFPALRGEDARVLDVVSPIRRFEMFKGEKLYWERSQGHFTPLGCDVVGQVLARHIADNRILEP
jgi:hypothetical protein